MSDPAAKPPGGATARARASSRRDRLAEAFAYALELHAGQVRKQADGEGAAEGIPYIAHLMAVAGLVLEHGGDEEEAIAALLHDGPEDQGGEATLAVIRRRFGDRVARIVEECTDTFEQPKPEWWARKREYHGNLRRASAAGVLVSLADKVHNAESTLADVRALGEGVWSRFTQGRRGSLWNYASLLEIYRERASGPAVRLVDRLDRALDGLFVDEDERARALGWGRSTTRTTNS
jgi:GTP pyrophosphokinase